MMKNQQHNQDTQQHATEENRALIIKLYKAFMGGDIPAVLADLSPKVEWADAEGFP